MQKPGKSSARDSQAPGFGLWRTAAAADRLGACPAFTRPDMCRRLAGPFTRRDAWLKGACPAGYLGTGRLAGPFTRQDMCRRLPGGMLAAYLPTGQSCEKHELRLLFAGPVLYCTVAGEAEKMRYSEARRNRSGKKKKSMPRCIFVLMIAAIIALSGCIGVGQGEYEAYPEEALKEETAPMASKSVSQLARNEQPAGRVAGAEMLAAAPEMDSVIADSGPVGAPMGGQEGSQEGEPGDGEPGTGKGDQVQERLRVYSAELEMAVTSVNTSRESLIDLAEKAGGYVESSSMNYVVLRVPAADFESVLARVESIGTVLTRSVRTADVTDQFSDLERRIDLAERTRERLYDLLDRADETEERVKILREIRRLTEEIERLRGELESLDQLIRFSRIAVSLTARIARENRSRDAIPFPWIAWLDPIGVTTGEASQVIGLEVPEDFAVFEDGKRWLAEAAEGTRLKAGMVANEPRGDTEFWAAALAYHLADYYRSAERVEYGRFRGVLFESKDAQPFYYLAAVHAADDSIIVAEVFFPDKEAFDRRSGQIGIMLGKAYTK